MTLSSSDKKDIIKKDLLQRMKDNKIFESLDFEVNMEDENIPFYLLKDHLNVFEKKK
eukprot:CAMPEP_0170533748 /NCGR_PEP_ID=MMETSP0209-20121228/84867_1 /TAXON_ID=665100 ORGANISM="Litonotus pictus, Strain P1" /NCGR_SAMPLE_ID=MMETSP0209 /ASSEMBLY_ACC=CAM_ASM_000301 /LENGTH=56 /DNA_ID=CAMNT_0010831931 /DNA_START=10 /DNA_END=177 /DNA_ORIENTATION=+